MMAAFAGQFARPPGHKHVQADYENDRETRHEDADDRRLAQKLLAVL